MGSTNSSITGGDGDNSSTYGACTPEFIAAFGYVALISLLCVALLILIVFSCLEGKVRKVGSCKLWLPGLAAPVSFLVRPRHRFIYILLFGVMSTQALFIFNNLDIPSIPNVYGNLLYKVFAVPAVIVLSLSLLYYPLFACVERKHKLLGHIIGLMYSAVWFSQFVCGDVLRQYHAVFCGSDIGPPVDVRVIVVSVLTYVPVLLICMYIMIWYLNACIGDCVKMCVAKKKLAHEITEDDIVEPRFKVQPYQLQHVKSLFKKQPPVLPPTTKLQYVLLRVKEELFPYNTEFRFPLAFAGAVVAMSLLLYQLSFLLASFGFIFIDDVSVNYVEHVQPVLQRAGAAANSTTVRRIFEILLDVFNAAFIGVPVVVVIAPFVSLILCGLLLFHMVASVSKIIKKVAKHGFKHLPSPSSRVPAAWKYIGYQIGFFVFTWIIYDLIALLVGLAVIVLVILLQEITEPLIIFLLYLLVPLIWAKLFLFLLNVICYFAFYADKKAKFISITNRGLFNWISYILFFYNGFVGFMGAVLRTLMGSAFSLILLFRLDTIVLMPGFKTFDYGHNSFLGFLYLDYVYNNAVLHVFFSILLDPDAYGRPHDRETPDLVQGCGIIERGEENGFMRPTAAKRQMLRNRWLLAYTLLKNPSLQKLRYNALNPPRTNTPSVKSTAEEESTHSQDGSPEPQVTSSQLDINCTGEPLVAVTTSSPGHQSLTNQSVHSVTFEVVELEDVDPPLREPLQSVTDEAST